MATIKEITTKCKSGQLDAAYELAKTDIGKYPQYPWPKSNMGWVLYYMIKDDIEKQNRSMLLLHIEEVAKLGLDKETDSMMLGNLAGKISYYIHNLTGDETEIQTVASAIFQYMKGISFAPSVGYSYLLSAALRLKTWPLLREFIEWWGIDNLRSEDYQSAVLTNGRKMLPLAERVYNAYTSCLLASHSIDRIHDFLPALENLVNTHPEMRYPSFCYVKLLIEINADKRTILASYIPFARRKSTEYWVWERMSDIVNDDKKLQLACLLRALSCTRDENFLGPTRVKLAKLYAETNDRARARHQVDKVHLLYLRNGWRVPSDIQDFIHAEWFDKTSADSSTPEIDYMALTNGILYTDTKECFGIVTYMDRSANLAHVIYGMERRAAVRLKFKVHAGNILKLYYIDSGGRGLKILNAFKSRTEESLPFVKRVDGIVSKREGQQFALLKTSAESLFIKPNIVSDNSLVNGDHIKGVAVYDYDKKKEKWNWSVLTVKH